MRLVCTARLHLLTAFVTLLAFGGDIVTDALADARGDHCVSQTSDSDSHHEKTPCAHCSCAVHNGAAVAFSSLSLIAGASAESGRVPTSNETAPPPLPALIDHPPQLA